MTLSPTGIATRLLAISAGVAAAWAWPDRERATAADAAERPVETRRGDASQPDVAALLTALLSEVREKSEKEAGRELGTALFGFYDELRQNLAPAADPKAAFLALVAAAEAAGGFDDEMLATDEGLRRLATLGVRYAQWIDRDPHGALAALDRESEVMNWVNNHFISRISTERVERDGLRASMAWLKDVRPDFAAWNVIATDLGKRGSAEDLKWLLENHRELPGDRWSSYGLGLLGGQWPLDRKDDLIGALDGEPRAKALAEIAARMEGQSRLEWLRGWLESGDLDEETRKALAEGNATGRLVASDRLSIPDKIALIRELGGDGDDKQLGNQLVTQALAGFLDDPEQDWLFAFRHGMATAGDVREAALAACLDPGGARGEFDSQLFRHLAEDDLDSAMTLLDGMSEQDQDWQKIYAARWWFHGVDPDRFVGLVSSVSLDDDPAAQDALWQAWRDKSGPNLERYGEGYLDWVKALPAGRHRDWALQGLQSASQGSYPWVHEDVTRLLEEKP